jgi:hypothetical protein
MFSIPACTRYKGKHIGGFLMIEREDLFFVPSKQFRERLPPDTASTECPWCARCASYHGEHAEHIGAVVTITARALAALRELITLGMEYPDAHSHVTTDFDLTDAQARTLADLYDTETEEAAPKFKRPLDAALFALIASTGATSSGSDKPQPTEATIDAIAKAYDVEAQYLAAKYRQQSEEGMPFLRSEQRRAIAFLHAHGEEPYYRHHGLCIGTETTFSNVNFMSEAVSWIEKKSAITESVGR